MSNKVPECVYVLIYCKLSKECGDVAPNICHMGIFTVSHGSHAKAIAAVRDQIAGEGWRSHEALIFFIKSCFSTPPYLYTHAASTEPFLTLLCVQQGQKPPCTCVHQNPMLIISCLCGLSSQTTCFNSHGSFQRLLIVISSKSPKTCGLGKQPPNT